MPSIGIIIKSLRASKLWFCLKPQFRKTGYWGRVQKQTLNQGPLVAVSMIVFQLYQDEVFESKNPEYCFKVLKVLMKHYAACNPPLQCSSDFTFSSPQAIQGWIEKNYNLLSSPGHYGV